MRKLSKYLPVFPLWFAALSILAHPIIPHDHHFLSSCFGQTETCPAENEKPDHEHGIPIHCQAFNDVTSEKASNYQISWKAQIFDVVIFQFSDEIFILSENQCVTISDSRKPFKDPDLLTGLQLRGPPGQV